MISTNVANQLDHDVRKSHINATGVTNDSLNIIGQTFADIRIATRLLKNQTLYVANGISQHAILRTDFLARLGEVTYNYNNCTLKIDNDISVPAEENAVRAIVMLI